MSNVIPLHPPYSGAVKAIAEILSKNNFNESVVGKGWIEVRIVANFTDTNAMFHTVQARQVELSEPPPAGTTILRMVATGNEWPMDALVEVATPDELSALDSAFEKVSDDEKLMIALMDQGMYDTIEKYDLEDACVLLDILFERYQMKVSGPFPIDGDSAENPAPSAEEKKEYATPVLTPLGSVKDTTASGSGRFCPNGKPKPPTGNCGH